MRGPLAGSRFRRFVGESRPCRYDRYFDFTIISTKNQYRNITNLPENARGGPNRTAPRGVGKPYFRVISTKRITQVATTTSEASVAVRTMVSIWEKLRLMPKQVAINTAHTPW